MYNRFEPLVSQTCDSGELDELMECFSGDEHAQSGLNVQLVGGRVGRALVMLGGSVLEIGD